MFNYKKRNKNINDIKYKKIPLTPDLLSRKYEEEMYIKYKIKKHSFCDTK